MIETLLANKDTSPYAIAITAIIGAVTVGYMLGNKDPAVVCAPQLVQIEELTTKASELNKELTECKSKGVGGAAVSCQAVCARQVEKALAIQKVLECDD